VNYKIYQIDNLNNKEYIRHDLGKIIFETVNSSIYKSNNGEYTKSELDILAKRKSAERAQKELKEKYIVYIEANHKIIGFAAISIKNNNYLYSWLQVIPEYRGMGFSNILSEKRDNYLRNINIKEVLIESFKFKETLSYHVNRGFVKHKDQVGFTDTVRMIKKL